MIILFGIFLSGIIFTAQILFLVMRGEEPKYVTVQFIDPENNRLGYDYLTKRRIPFEHHLDDSNEFEQ